MASTIPGNGVVGQVTTTRGALAAPRVFLCCLRSRVLKHSVRAKTENPIEVAFGLDVQPIFNKMGVGRTKMWVLGRVLLCTDSLDAIAQLGRFPSEFRRCDG